MQRPFAQQPLAQVVALHEEATQAFPEHACPAAVQSWHAAPLAPQATSDVPSTHALSEQQPFGQLAASQVPPPPLPPAPPLPVEPPALLVAGPTGVPAAHAASAGNARAIVQTTARLTWAPPGPRPS